MAELNIKVSGIKLPHLPRFMFRKWVLAVYALDFLLAGAVTYWVVSSNIAPRLDRSEYSSVGYTVYYPKRLPGGYEFVPSSFKIVEGSQGIEFHLQKDDVDILVSEAANPRSDFDQLYEQRMSEVKTVALPIGKLTMGAFKANDSRHGSSLVTDRTWVTMFAPPTISYSDLVALNRSLRPLP